MPVERDPEQAETQILHNLLNFANRHILEIGCGDGRLTWRYAPTAGSVAGIDLDHNQLLGARQACQPFLQTKVFFTLADSLALPFPASQFDTVLLAWSL